MNTLLYLILTLLLLSIMVVIHELGHFLFAKLFRVTVLEFSVGMGPAVFTTKNRNKKKRSNSFNIGNTFHSPDDKSEFQTQYLDTDTKNTVFSIRAFPIGGYVSMVGEDDASDDINAFCNKPVWQRFIITVAGAIMNILLGVACMFLLVGIESVQDGYLASNTIYDFQEGSISNKCESPLMAGDTVIKVDGIRVHTGNELVYEIMHSGNEPIDLVVIRNGEEITLHGVTFPIENTQGVAFGDYDFVMQAEKANFKSIIKHSFYRSFSTVKVITDSLIDLVKGRYGAEAVSGPVGMAGAVGEATRSGFDSVLYLFTLITMNLGVFNLLPIPALDGGRIIFLVIEAIIGRPVKKEIEQSINTAGIMILMALMLFITVKDIFNLF